jgi:hypothetical protein
MQKLWNNIEEDYDLQYLFARDKAKDDKVSAEL